jgi:hypothetical protein
MANQLVSSTHNSAEDPTGQTNLLSEHSHSEVFFGKAPIKLTRPKIFFRHRCFELPSASLRMEVSNINPESQHSPSRI